MEPPSVQEAISPSGEQVELELGDQKRAVEAYETAAGWYENDNAEA